MKKIKLKHDMKAAEHATEYPLQLKSSNINDDWAKSLQSKTPLKMYQYPLSVSNNNLKCRKSQQ